MLPIPSKVGVNVTVLTKEELVVESVAPTLVQRMHELVGQHERYFHGSQFVGVVLVTAIDIVRLHWQPWFNEALNVSAGGILTDHAREALGMLRHVPVYVIVGALPCNLRDLVRRQLGVRVQFEKVCLKMPPMWSLQLVLDHSLRWIK